MVMLARIVVLLLALTGVAHAAEYTAAVDRKDLSMDESLTLTLSLINSDTRLRAEGVSPNVDLSVLTRDFDLGTPRADNRYNIYRGRGRSTSAISVQLFPRRAGRLTIPSFSIDSLRTAPLTVQVHALPAGSLPEAYARGGVSKSSVYMREQFIAWLDIYHRVELKNAKLGGYLETEPVQIELLEHRQLPEGKREEKIKGVTYQVKRIAWAIFPKQSGRLQIFLPEVWLLTQDNRELRLPHREETVDIRSLPANVPDNIAVGKVELSQTPLDRPAAVNAFSTWTVTARGPYSRTALPDNLPLPPASANVRLYVDRAQRETVDEPTGSTNVVTYTLSAMPQASGAFTLPPVRIPYFDPERGALAIAEAPGQTLTAAPAPASDATPTAAAPVTAGANQPVQRTAGNDRTWQFVSLGLALGWLATAILWRRSRTKPAVAKNPPHGIASQQIDPRPLHPLQALLLGAFGTRTLEQGLIDWETRHDINEEVRAAVRAVQQLCYGQNCTIDTQDLQARAEKAASLIRTAARRITPSHTDPWAPETFTSRLPIQSKNP